jgi:hypothetical protein
VRLRRVGGNLTIGLAVAAIAVLAGQRPALASARSVVLADGSSLKVWEPQTRARCDQAESSRVLNYSVTDASGTRQGIVPPTGDAALDSAPYLSIDATGAAVLVWSRYDGVFRKIAYSRFSGGVWADFHYLSFGPGDDLLPRIGAGSTGAFLFFLRPPDRFLYAPVDLIAGRLFAAPRAVDLGSARRDIEAPRLLGSAFGADATVDIPVVNRCQGRLNCVTPSRSGSGSLQSGGIAPSGGTVDIPVVNGHTKAAVWNVGSSGDCSRMVLVIPSYDATKAFVFRFAGGSTSLVDTVLLPSPITQHFADNLAASHLPFVCN